MRISIHNTGEIDVLILSAAKKRGSISSNWETGEVSLIRYRCIFLKNLGFFLYYVELNCGCKTE